MPRISQNALVQPGARLADDVVVGPFSYVGPEVSIGPGCILYNNVTVTGRTSIGPNTRIFPMAVLGGQAPGQGAGNELKIAADNAIREHVTIYAGTDDKPTVIGTDNLIMIGCHVGAGAQLGDHGIFVNSTVIGSEAVLEDYVRTSGFITIHPGVRVGAYTFTVGYAEIDRDAPPFAMVQGARVRGANVENLRRCGFSQDDIQSIRGAFREMYNGSGDSPRPEALIRLDKQPDLNPYVRRLVEAVKLSQVRN